MLPSSGLLSRRRNTPGTRRYSGKNNRPAPRSGASYDRHTTSSRRLWNDKRIGNLRDGPQMSESRHQSSPPKELLAHICTLLLTVQLRHHVFDHRVVVNGVGGHVFTVAGLPKAAVGHLGDEGLVVVDPNRPEP